MNNCKSWFRQMRIYFRKNMIIEGNLHGALIEQDVMYVRFIHW